MYTQKSFTTKKDDLNGNWWVIDAADLVVGRVATQVANVLRGKHKPTFTPNHDCGDFVIITNCEKVKFTGKKWSDKKYHWHTGYIGGIKQRTATEQLQKHPELIMMEAVKGMLPKTSLGRKQLTKLKVFVGPEHSHEAQKPQEMKL